MQMRIRNHNSASFIVTPLCQDVKRGRQIFCRYFFALFRAFQKVRRSNFPFMSKENRRMDSILRFFMFAMIPEKE